MQVVVRAGLAVLQLYSHDAVRHYHHGHHNLVYSLRKPPIGHTSK